MNPEEKHLLERTLKVSEENNKILKSVQARAKRQVIYGFIKLLIVVVPFVLGYIFLEPYINQIGDNYNSVMEMFQNLPR